MTFSIYSDDIKFPFKINLSREFPGGPVVRTWRFHGQGPGSVASRGTKITQAAWRGQKKKKKRRVKKDKIKLICLNKKGLNLRTIASEY